MVGGESLKDKSTSTIAQFLYEIICRHGCMKIQINDQRREFVNEVSKVLHNMIGTEQRTTSAYHPQSNGFCERQNRITKDSSVKVAGGNPCDWPNIIEGVLFVHRVSKHTSTKFSPFFLMYNREPTLPIDVKCNLVDIKRNESEHLFDKTFAYNCDLHETKQASNGWKKTFVRLNKNNAVIIIDAIKYLTRSKWIKKCLRRIIEG